MDHQKPVSYPPRYEPPRTIAKIMPNVPVDRVPEAPPPLQFRLNRTDRPDCRERIYELIDGERNYQDNLGYDRTNGHHKSVGEYITMMGHYYNKLLEAWTDNPGDRHALDVMRKIGGIAVNCMENHSTPARGEIPNY